MTEGAKKRPRFELPGRVGGCLVASCRTETVRSAGRAHATCRHRARSAVPSDVVTSTWLPSHQFARTGSLQHEPATRVAPRYSTTPGRGPSRYRNTDGRARHRRVLPSTHCDRPNSGSAGRPPRSAWAYRGTRRGRTTPTCADRAPRRPGRARPAARTPHKPDTASVAPPKATEDRDATRQMESKRLVYGGLGGPTNPRTRRGGVVTTPSPPFDPHHTDAPLLPSRTTSRSLARLLHAADGIRAEFHRVGGSKSVGEPSASGGGNTPGRAPERCPRTALQRRPDGPVHE